MTNLLKETIEVLSEHRKKPKDVVWVGSRDGKWFMTWKDFAQLADREYDNGYGGEEVALDLAIVGKDWWLERHEYDGSEWWEYKALPTLVRDPKNITKIFVENYEHCIEQLMNPDKEDV